MENNNTSNNNLDKFKDIHKNDSKKFKNTIIKTFKKSTSFLSNRKISKGNNNQNEKKKVNYLNVISRNISENRKTLKNPGEFYAGFFASIIEKQKNVGTKLKITNSFKDKILEKDKTDSKIGNNFYEIKNNNTLRSNSMDNDNHF